MEDFIKFFWSHFELTSLLVGAAYPRLLQGVWLNTTWQLQLVWYKFAVANVKKIYKWQTGRSQCSSEWEPDQAGILLRVTICCVLKAVPGLGEALYQMLAGLGVFYTQKWHKFGSLDKSSINECSGKVKCKVTCLGTRHIAHVWT